ncbi:centrosome-associated protein ALMS1 [Discoglossus pictus]
MESQEGEGAGGSGTPPPIATTPPVSRFCLFEELQSESSSPGTQISCTSGISLGEAIRQTASQSMESWYQLPAEEDVSSFMPTLEEQTELPTMEEGTIHPEPDHGQRPSAFKPHSISLEIQDSRLSPCLPLLTSGSAQGQKFFDSTLFQQTETDFAPLRGSPDTSEFPEHPSKLLQISDAVALAGKEISLDTVHESFMSQNLMGTSAGEAGDASSMYNLSQHPLSASHFDRGDFVALSPHTITGGDVPSIEGLQSLTLAEHALSPQEQAHTIFTQADGLFLDTNVPAPLLLELLEKEVGLSGSSGGMSSRSSSSHTISAKETESKIILHNIELEQQNPRTAYQVLNEGPVTSDQLGEESFKDSSEVNFFSAESFRELEQEIEDPNVSGITVRSSRQSMQASNEDLHKQLCSEIQQKYKERELSKSKNSSSTALQNSKVLSEPSNEPEGEKDNTVMVVPSRVSKGDLTVSSQGSIERGHKDTGISPADNPAVEDASFIGRLAHPISQSTPGTFAVQRARKQLSGKIMQIKAKLTGSEMSLNEEVTVTSTQTNIAPYGMHQSLQSSHEYPESSDSQRSSSPQQRRIQSLPSLNYIEKVGAWNTNQSFDALVLRGLTGVSPKKKAYSAVADSLNRLFSSHAAGAMQKRGLAASFAGTSSMTSLNSKEKDSTSTSQITRSQSYNSITTMNTEIQPNTQIEPEVKPLKEEIDEIIMKTDIVQINKSLTDDVETQGSVSVSTVVANERDIEHNTRDESQQERVLSVAERTLKCDEEIDQPNTDQETSADKSNHNLHLVANNRTMDHFSDVSLDNDFLGSSHSSDQINQMFTSSATAASMHSLTSLEIDNFVPFWSPSEKSPERKEFNLEERIPTYLRNLGIDQSPTTILTPFAPKGPIREPEFSPSEFRTIKGSTATPTRSLQLSEAGSQSAVNISQSSVYSSSSTASVSIPMGSEHGHASPLPTEMSPHLGFKTTNDKPLSQNDLTSNHIKPEEDLLGVKKREEETVNMLADEQQKEDTSTIQSFTLNLQPVEENPTEELNRVKQLVHTFEHIHSELSFDHQSLGIYDLEGKADLVTLTRSSEKKQAMDSTSDSFVGSKTLKEIRKLLAGADNYGLDESGGGFPSKSLLKSSGELSPLSLNFDDSLRSDSFMSGNASPGGELVRSVSWDASLNSSVSNDKFLQKKSSTNAGFDWHNSVNSDNNNSDKTDSYLQDIVEDKRDISKHQKHFGRSEPEGSSEATIDKMVALNLKLQNRISGKESVDASIGERTAELLNSVTTAVGGLAHALAVTGAGYSRARDEVLESDDSSGDSLAARVTSLLRNDAAIPRATHIQSIGENEQRIRGSMKLKLTTQQSFIETDLNLEDRKRIEEIKRELLKGAKEARATKNLTNVDRGHWKDTDQFRLHFTQSPILEQSHNLKPTDLPESTTEQIASPSRDGPYNNQQMNETNAAFKNATSMTALSEKSNLTPTFDQRDTISVPFHTGYQPRDQLEMDSEKHSCLSLAKADDDITKPITSITFASRKRYSPLPFSIYSELSCHQQTSDVQLTSRDKKSIGKFGGSPLISKPNDEPVKVLQDEPISQLDISSTPEVHIQVDYVDMSQSIDQSSSIDKGGFKVNESNSFDNGKSGLMFNRSSEHSSAALAPSMGKATDDNLEVQRSTVTPSEQDLNGFPIFRQKSVSTEITFDKENGDYYANVIPESTRGPSPAMKESTRGPSPAMKESTRGPSPAMKESTRGPSPAMKESTRGPSPAMKESTRGPSPAMKESTRGPSPAMKESTRGPSPTRKALSCVHVTISPKLDNCKKIDIVLEKPTIQDAFDPSNKITDGILSAYTTEISTLNSTTISRNEHTQSGQDFLHNKDSTLDHSGSYFLHHTNEVFKSVTKADQEVTGPLIFAFKKDHVQERHSPSSDATTQITTESPVKTTFSAEIFIDKEQDDKIYSSSNKKTEEPSNIQASTRLQVPYLSRATDQPLLLPYRPPGSPELFYVPYLDRGSRLSPVRSDTTVESSHPGSNDAVSPKFPVEVLGSAKENISDFNILKHKDGIYSKDTTPQTSWKESTHDLRKAGVLESSISKSVSKPVQNKSQALSENNFGSHTASYERLQQKGSHIVKDNIEKRRRHGRDRLNLTSHQKENEFFSLKPEVDYGHDYSLGHHSDINLRLSYGALSEVPARSQTRNSENNTPVSTQTTVRHSGYSPMSSGDFRTPEIEKPLRNSNYTSSSSQTTDAMPKNQDIGSILNQSKLSNCSLDDLWARFTERKKNQLSDSSSKLEMSLVERLDRLARLLQNPVANSSSFPNGEQIMDQDRILDKKQNSERQWESKMADGDRGFQTKLSANKRQKNGLSTLNEIKVPSRPVGILQHRHYVDNPRDGLVDSDLSSEVRSAETESATTDTETVTQTDSDTQTQLGVNSSISTIDTVRLIKAFGPDRVCPSSRLSHLYNTIDSQKRRTEESTRKHTKRSAVKESSKIEFAEVQKCSKTQVAESDTVSTSSWEPSPALIQKKKTRVLDKGVQAGDLEIVTSATKKNTRDVGTTFPSPCRDHQSSMEPSIRGQNMWATSVLTERREGRSKLHLPQGLSWFVPAEDLKSDSRKENKSTINSGPGPAWQVSFINTKPLREPLREKNLQELLITRHRSQLNGSEYINDVETKSQKPFVKVTLQESLKTYRPDFIFHSGERVKRLQLLAKERKLQTMFQNERDELFNQLPRRGGGKYTHRQKERSRIIPKKEMVQHSKRIYEQLPEVKKKREDEKRRSEYESYRLKAQLFRKKVTNHILGRKTPWN